MKHVFKVFALSALSRLCPNGIVQWLVWNEYEVCKSAATIVKFNEIVNVNLIPRWRKTANFYFIALYTFSASD